MRSLLGRLLGQTPARDRSPIPAYFHSLIRELVVPPRKIKLFSQHPSLSTHKPYRKWTNQVRRTLKKCPNIERLDLSQVAKNVNYYFVHTIAPFVWNIRDLDLSDCRGLDQQYALLFQNMKALTKVTLASTRIGHQGLTKLVSRHFASLEYLDIRDCVALTVDDTDLLLGCRKLQYLDITGWYSFLLRGWLVLIFVALF